MPTITELCIKHKCDKAAIGHHTYGEPYEKQFAHLRDADINILEIGVGGYGSPAEGGCSLRVWKEWFSKAKVHSIDIVDKSAINEDRITTYLGSQTDEVFLKALNEKIGGFDIIIDDGSHVNSDVITSFKILFPLLKQNGIYVVEDCQTSYWKHYGGGAENSSVNFFKSFIDGLNYLEIATEAKGNGRAVATPSYFDMNIISIQFYHNMIFVFKGDNTLTR